LMLTSKVVIAVERWWPIVNKHCWLPILIYAPMLAIKPLPENCMEIKLSAKIKSVQKFFFRKIIACCTY
jgi:hypothetical protein